MLNKINKLYLNHILHFLTQLQVLKKFKNIVLKCKMVSYFKLEIFLNSKWVYPILYYFKSSSITRLQNCVDIIVIDQPKAAKRFTLTYLLSSLFNFQLKVITKVTQLQSVLTITSLFSACIWLEREIFDLFGIYFLFNTDLRTILTDYGFQGFPLRKDFPLAGYIEIFYDDNNKTIVTRQIELSQIFKNFFFKTLW